MNPLMMVDDDGGYAIQRSIRTRASASAYLNRTPASAGNRQIWTWSNWVKRGSLGSYQLLFGATSGGVRTGIWFESADRLFMYDDGAGGFDLSTSYLFRDPAAYYHIAVAFDTTQATASNRVKVYVNGLQVTSFFSSNYPSLNFNTQINNTGLHTIGKNPIASDNYLDGYQAELNMVSGLQLTPSSFGSTNSTTGVWQPARYTGTYGTNGFYLPFTDNSALTTSSNVGLGKDFSGNGNYWTTNNISITAGVTYDSMTDVPTLTSSTAANFAVWNPLYQPSGSGAAAFSNGNLLATPISAAFDNVGSSILMPATGYWYAEFTGSGASISGNTNMIGIVGQSDLFAITAANFVGFTANSYGYLDTGNLRNNNVTSQTVAAMGTNPIVMVAFGNGKLWWGLNGTWLGTGSPNPATATSPAYSGLTGNYGFAATSYNTTGGLPWVANFGQRPFTYTPPSGFVALNTYNLPDSTIKQGNKVMDATLYTGNGSTQTITNAAGFKPDFVWIKGRATAYNNALFDSIRGTNNVLISNTTDAAGVETAGSLSAFNSNGFTLASGAAAYASTNVSGQTFVGWQWQAGQGVSSANTSGTITSTVSVNASAGFSVVTYTGNGTAGATIGHGLGVAPPFIIIKNRTGASNWIVMGSFLGVNKYLLLQSNNAAATGAPGYDNGTLATSSVFSVSAGTDVNGSPTAYVAYCWSEIAGYSKFGSYTGTPTLDGPFVYLGFRPKFVMWKRTDGVASWVIYDGVRNPYNLATLELRADTSGAEITDTTIDQPVDFLSNGFKLRGYGSYGNANGGNYIYMAFAENPFKNSLAR